MTVQVLRAKERADHVVACHAREHVIFRKVPARHPGKTRVDFLRSAWAMAGIVWCVISILAVMTGSLWPGLIGMATMTFYVACRKAKRLMDAHAAFTIARAPVEATVQGLLGTMARGSLDERWAAVRLQKKQAAFRRAAFLAGMTNPCPAILATRHITPGSARSNPRGSLNSSQVIMLITEGCAWITACALSTIACIAGKLELVLVAAPLPVLASIVRYRICHVRRARMDVEQQDTCNTLIFVLQHWARGSASCKSPTVCSVNSPLYLAKTTRAISLDNGDLSLLLNRPVDAEQLGIMTKRDGKKRECALLYHPRRYRPLKRDAATDSLAGLFEIVVPTRYTTIQYLRRTVAWPFRQHWQARVVRPFTLFLRQHRMITTASRRRRVTYPAKAMLSRALHGWKQHFALISCQLARTRGEKLREWQARVARRAAMRAVHRYETITLLQRSWHARAHDWAVNLKLAKRRIATFKQAAALRSKQNRAIIARWSAAQAARRATAHAIARRRCTSLSQRVKSTLNLLSRQRAIHAALHVRSRPTIPLIPLSARWKRWIACNWSSLSSAVARRMVYFGARARRSTTQRAACRTRCRAVLARNTIDMWRSRWIRSGHGFLRRLFDRRVLPWCRKWSAWAKRRSYCAKAAKQAIKSRRKAMRRSKVDHERHVDEQARVWHALNEVEGLEQKRAIDRGFTVEQNLVFERSQSLIASFTTIEAYHEHYTKQWGADAISVPALKQILEILHSRGLIEVPWIGPRKKETPVEEEPDKVPRLTVFQESVLKFAERSSTMKYGSFGAFHAAFERHAKRAIDRTALEVAIHQLQAMNFLSVPWKARSKTHTQQQEARRRENKHYELKNHLTSRQRRALVIGCACMCIMFGVQLVQSLDSYFSVDPAGYSFSGISTSSDPAFHVGDNYTVSFTSTANYGSGWLIYYDAHNHEVFRQPSNIKKGENHWSTVIAGDFGFYPGRFSVKAIVSWSFWGFILRTALVGSASFTITKEPTSTFLSCTISMDDNQGSALRVIYTGSLVDDDKSPVARRVIGLSWYNIDIAGFQAVASVITGTDGTFQHVEYRNRISPFPFLCRAKFDGDATCLNSSDDDTVTQDEVYASWRHAGPDGDHDYVYSGIPAQPKNTVLTNQTTFSASWNWGTLDGTGNLDGWSMRAMEGRPFSGISNHTAYIGSFSWFSNVSFLFSSPWLVFSGKNASSANLTLRYRSLWEIHGTPDTKRGKDTPIYSIYACVFNDENMIVYAVNVSSGDAIPWTTTTIPLAPLFTNPMKFRIGIGGTINTMSTTVHDLWDEQMLEFDSCSILARHNPAFASSSLVSGWNGYDMVVMNTEGASESQFTGSRVTEVTNMPEWCSSTTADSIHGAIYTPITSGNGTRTGILNNYHIQMDWRKSGQQTWGLGSADGFDYASSMSHDFLSASPGMVSTAEANWRVQWSNGVQRSWAELALKGSFTGSGYRWIGMGVEMQAPLVPGRQFEGVRARVVLDMDTCIASSDQYNVSIAVQGGTGLIVRYTGNKAQLSRGQHVVTVDLTPAITNATGVYYFMIILEGSSMWSPWRYVKARVESIEIIATYTDASTYIGMSASAGAGPGSWYSSPQAEGEWVYEITSYNDTYSPVDVQFLGTGCISRLVRGGVVDAGIYARVTIELERANGTSIAFTVFNSWVNPTIAWFALNWTLPAVCIAGVVAVHFKFRIDVASQGSGSGSTPGDIYAIHLSSLRAAGISLARASWVLMDMMSNGSAWSYSTTTASGELAAQPIGESDGSIAMRVAGYSSAVPASNEKVFAARLIGPALDASTLRTETNSMIELEFMPFITSPLLPLYTLGNQSARVRVLLELHVDVWGSFSPMVSFLVDEFDITVANINTTRFAWADISPYLGVPAPLYGGYINLFKIGVSVSIDVAGAWTPGVSWGCEIRNHMLTVIDLPSRPQFINLSPVLHGIYPITVRGQGDETDLWLEYAIDNGEFELYTHSTQHVGNTWTTWFDTLQFDDTENLSLRVYMEDSVGLRNTEHVLEATGLRIDNTAPLISGISGLQSDTILARNTNISIETGSIDAAMAVFQFVRETESWSSNRVVTYIDDDASDGLNHVLMIYDLDEGTYKARITLFDGTHVLNDTMQFCNITIIHVFPEIIEPVPGSTSDGHVIVKARTGTSLVASAAVFIGFTADGTMDNVSSWFLVGESSQPVNNSFSFQLEPEHFGVVELWTFIRVDFVVNDTMGGVINDTASVLLYIDTITPSITMDYAPGHAPDGQGIVMSPLAFDISTSTPGQIETVEVYARGPDSAASQVIARAIDPALPWTCYFTPTIDGPFQFYAVARDTAGNKMTTSVLATTVDLHPLAIQCTSPALNRTIWFNQSEPVVSIPIEIYSLDCDIDLSTLHLEYRWIHDAAWTPFTTAWNQTSPHVIAGVWSANTSSLDAYPFYQFRVTASDHRGNASAFTSALLVTTNDMEAPRLIRFTNGFGAPIAWGDLVALEIEALDESLDDAGMLFVEIWNRTPGALYDPADTSGLIDRLFGNGSYHALVNSSLFASGIIYLRAVDRAFNQNITAMPVIVLREWSCTVANDSYVRTENGTLAVSLAVRETDLQGIQFSLSSVVNGSPSLHQVFTNASNARECIASFSGLANGEYVLETRVMLSPALTSFPTPWRSTYIPALHFTVDDLPPELVTINNVLNFSIINTGSLRMNASCVENSGQVTYFLQINGTVQSLSEYGQIGSDGLVAWTGAALLPDGEYDITLIARDPAGNNATAAVTQRIIIDNSPATITDTIFSPAMQPDGSIMTRDTVVVSFSSADPVSLITEAWIEIGTGTSTRIAWSRSYSTHTLVNASTTIHFGTLGLPAGHYTLSIHVHGTAGEAVKSWDVVYDNEVPDAWFVAPAASDAVIVGENATFMVGCADISGIASVCMYRGQPGAGGMLLGQAMPAEGSSSTWCYVLAINEYIASSYYIVVTDLMGNANMTSIDRVVLVPTLLVTTSLLDAAIIGSPVNIDGTISIEGGGVAPGTEIQVGAWYAVAEGGDWTYLGSSSTLQVGSSPTMFYELTFDTDSIDRISSAQYVPTALGISDWSNDLYSAKMTGFAGDFDGQGNLEILYVSLSKEGDRYSLRVHAVRKVGSSWFAQRASAGQLAFTFALGEYADFSILDMTTGDIDNDEKTELLILDNHGYLHVIGYGETIPGHVAKALPDYVTCTAVDFDPASSQIVFGCTTGSGPAILLWNFGTDFLLDTDHLIPVSDSEGTGSITSLDVDDLALTGDSRHAILFGTSNSIGYMDMTTKAVHVVDSGFSVKGIAAGDLDLDGKNEIAASVVNGRGTCILIAYAWTEGVGSLAWTSSIVKDYGNLVMFSSIDVGLGLPEDLNPGEDLVVATSIGVTNYQLKAGITETVIPLQPGSWKSTNTVTSIDGRFDIATSEIPSFSAMKGTDAFSLDAITADDAWSTVVINEFGFASPEAGTGFDFIELYNWGDEAVFLAGMTIEVTPSILSHYAPDHSTLIADPREYTFPVPPDVPGSAIPPGSFVILAETNSLSQGKTIEVYLEEMLTAAELARVTILDAGDLFQDWIGWAVPAGAPRSPTWHDITITFGYDNFRAGDWFDDIGWIELCELDNIDYKPNSIYRHTTTDRNQESDFKIWLPGEAGQPAPTIGKLNPGQSAATWGKNPAQSYRSGDAPVHGYGSAQIMYIPDGSGTYAPRFSQKADTSYFSAPSSTSIGYYFTGSTDVVKHEYTSSQLLQTASGNHVTCASDGLAVPSAGDGLPVQFSGWSGSSNNIYDNLATTSVQVTSSTWRSYENRFFIYEVAGPSVSAVLPPLLNPDYVVDSTGDVHIPHIPASGQNIYQYGLMVPGTGLGSGEINQIQDTDKGGFVYSRDYLRTSTGVDPIFSLNFRMDQRVDALLISQGATVTLHIKALGLMEMENLYGGHVHVTYSVPISVSFGSLPFATKLGENRFIASAGEWGWGDAPTGTHEWSTYKDEALHEQDYTMSGAQFSNALSQGGNVILTLERPATYPQDCVIDGIPYQWDYVAIPQWVQDAGGNQVPDFQTRPAGYGFSLEAMHVYIEEAYIDVQLDGSGDKVLETQPFTITVPSPRPSSLSVSAKIDDRILAYYSTGAYGTAGGWDVLDDSFTNGAVFNRGHYTPWLAPEYYIGETAYSCQGLYTAGWLPASLSSRRHLEIEKDGAWIDLDLNEGEGSYQEIDNAHLQLIFEGTDMTSLVPSTGLVKLRFVYLVPEQFGLVAGPYRGHEFYDLTDGNFGFVQTQDLLSARAEVNVIELEVKATEVSPRTRYSSQEIAFDLQSISMPWSWAEIESMSDLVISFDHEEWIDLITYGTPACTAADLQSSYETVLKSNVRYHIDCFLYDWTAAALADPWVEINPGVTIFTTWNSYEVLVSNSLDDATWDADARKFIGPSCNHPDKGIRFKVKITMEWLSDAMAAMDGHGFIDEQDNAWVTNRMHFTIKNLDVSFAYFLKSKQHALQPRISLDTDSDTRNLRAHASSTTTVCYEASPLVGTQGVVINEIAGGLVNDVYGNFIEFMNYGTQVDLSEYYLRLYWESDYIGTKYMLGNFIKAPDSTMLAGNSLRVIEGIPVDCRTSMIVLFTPEGKVCDAFVGAQYQYGVIDKEYLFPAEWIGETTEIFPYNIAARNSDFDTNTPGDWNSITLPSLGSLNPGQDGVAKVDWTKVGEQFEITEDVELAASIAFKNVATVNNIRD
nr:hypothetical protein [Candidatus Sigynarchaeota archaeon]